MGPWQTKVPRRPLAGAHHASSHPLPLRQRESDDLRRRSLRIKTGVEERMPNKTRGTFLMCPHAFYGICPLRLFFARTIFDPRVEFHSLANSGHSWWIVFALSKAFVAVLNDENGFAVSKDC